ncbi:hypothetical protein ACFYT4_31050 [Streptomyces sp. NPDC004609]|uniref:hypothetical protein n=1 Tax=Streptomyces sp. NPDC004609 TaxID=3364704 RepID=UPI0036ADF463
MSPKNPRLTALVTLPVLAFAVACGGGGGVRGADEIASVPDAPATASGEPSKDAGGSAKAGESAFYDAQLEYVRCMRTKAGLKDFPDPKLSGYLDWSAIDAIPDPDGKGEKYKGGKNNVCGPEFLEAMNLEPKRDQQKDFESMLAHAQCMRDNGVSRFTNPVMSGGNAIPGGDPNPATPSIDRDSPAYKQARQACKSRLLDGLDGMQ